MDPQVEGLLAMMKAQSEAAGIPPMWELPADVARANAELGFEAFNGNVPASVTITDRKVPGPAGEIPVKVFTPQGGGPFPLLVFLHGGGWVIGSPNTHRQLCAQLAEGAGVVILSVDYRMAPENPAPASLDDCVAAIRWAVANAAALNARPERFAIGGDSAGGNLSAAAALCLRDSGGPAPSFLLLLYGAYSMDFDTDSYRANGKGFVLEQDAMLWFRNHYLSGGANADHPYISPLKGDLSKMPPALLVVGTLDPLLDDSRRFAEALQKAGGRATLSEYEDMPHVFLQLTDLLDGGKKAMAECVSALKAAIG